VLAQLALQGASSMGHFVVAVISVALFAVFVTFVSAIAGPFSDDLGKCLVRSTTDADKNYKSIAAVSDAARTELGPGTLQTSFEILGQVAGRGLFTDPAVARSMASFEDYLDKPKLEALFGPK
jgi:hypothetical protein